VKEIRRITLNDIRHAFCSAHLSAYLGTYSIFSNNKGYHRYGHAPHGWIYYLKGVGSSVCCFWMIQVESVNVAGSTPFTIAVGAKTSGAENRSFVRIAAGETKNPAAVYPGLSMSNGEVKIVVEVAPYHHPSSNSGNRLLNGRMITSKEAFGFFVIDPKITSYTGRETFFNTVIIFTPESGLFDESAPTN
jgi:hypothetical protein